MAVERPAEEALSRLEVLITARPGREPHLLADLALKMFAVQVLQYGKAVVVLSRNVLNSWAFPMARAAFESATDLSFLASLDEAEYDRLGAQVMVAAEFAVSLGHGKAQRASSRLRDDPEKQPAPLKERVGRLAEHWSRFRPGAEAIVWEAFDRCQAARHEGGLRHWTMLKREEIHRRLRDHLADPEFNLVMDSWYDILSTRSHPGSHSPGLEWDNGHLNFLLDWNQEQPVPLATARVSAELAVNALTSCFASWDNEK